MADKIRLSGGEANIQASRMNNSASIIKGEINKLISIVDGSASWWDGDSQKAFAMEFAKHKSEVDKMVDCVSKYTALLKKAIQLQQEADADIARQMREYDA